MPQVDVQTIIRNAAVMGRAMSVATKNRLISMERIRIWNNTMRSETRKTRIAQSGMWIPSALFVMETSSALQLRDNSVNTLTYQNVFSKMILYANQNRQIFTRQKVCNIHEIKSYSSADHRDSGNYFPETRGSFPG